MRPSGVITFDVPQIAAGLNLDPAEVGPWFKDGRHSFAIMERNFARRFGLTPPDNSCADHDLASANGDKWEVRSITARGISFAPSNMNGAGRKFTQTGLIGKLSDIHGYILADLEGFPDVPFWIIPTLVVSLWWQKDQIRSTARCSRPVIIELLSKAFFAPLTP